MLEPLYDIFAILNEWGLVSEDTVPLLFLLALFYLALHRFQFKKILQAHGDLKEKLGDLHHASMEMQKYLRRKSTDYDPIHTLEKLNWSSAQSPLDLNESGRTLLAASGLKTIIEEHVDELLRELANEEPDTKYDVEQSAHDVLWEFLEDHGDLLNQLKDFVYEHPLFEDKPLSLGAIMFVGSLMLRDAYLKSDDTATSAATEQPSDFDRLVA